MKRLAALVGLTWIAGALATVFRRRPLCQCGQPAEDDGLGFGLCAECALTADAGPLSMRSETLRKYGIGDGRT